MGKLNLKEGKRYTFNDYFYFNSPQEDIANEFGYQFETRPIEFVKKDTVAISDIKKLQTTFYENLPKITLTSERAKRDFMIAPLLWEIIRHIKAKIKVEYPIDIDEKLGGSLDYLVQSTQAIVIIEAKKGELEKGFNQLIVELIAMDKYQESTSTFLYGAVSIGELWRFGRLHCDTKQIVKDLHTYRVPEDLEDIFSIIAGILEPV